MQCSVYHMNLVLYCYKRNDLLYNVNSDHLIKQNIAVIKCATFLLRQSIIFPSFPQKKLKESFQNLFGKKHKCLFLKFATKIKICGTFNSELFYKHNTCEKISTFASNM